ncbi:MAG TPA: YciI family protein [Polyangia bacterium]|nr:YciI family protein [Polyangia bacterium]
MTGLSPQEMEASMNRWRAWIGQLSQAGQFKGGDPLAPSGRVVAGKQKAVTDGPFGETKDLVGGYLLVSAASLDAATELARGCPIFERGGSVEVREARAM